MVIYNRLLLKKWPIEIVDLPVKDGDFALRTDRLIVYQRVTDLKKMDLTTTNVKNEP